MAVGAYTLEKLIRRVNYILLSFQILVSALKSRKQPKYIYEHKIGDVDHCETISLFAFPR